MANYHRNFILCGDIDYHCLLCEESFQLPEEVLKHVRWENHRKLLKAQAYLPKFRKDCIYEVENRYYCEICNYVSFSTAALIKHINDEEHKTKKAGAQDQKSNEKAKLNADTVFKNVKVKQECDGNIIVISDTVVIKKNEWLGVINKQCMFCDVPVKDFEKHVACGTHIINLIQAKILQVDDEKIYRKINEDTLYCFKCKKMFPTKSIKEHGEKENHGSESTEVESETDEHMKFFSFDRNNNVATCQECKQVLRFNIDTLMRHRETHNENMDFDEELVVGEEFDEAALAMVHDHGKLRAELKEYGKDHFIKLNQGGSKAFCELCEVHIVPYIDNLKQHVKGVCHQGYLELKGLKKTSKKDKPYYRIKPWDQFCQSVSKMPDCNLIMINKDICIPLTNFITIKLVNTVPKILKCMTCDVTFHLNATKEHIQPHMAKALSVPIITNIKGEIIRELRPSLYHCGFCNTLQPGWMALESHLKSQRHLIERAGTEKQLVEAVQLIVGEEWNRCLDIKKSIELLD